MDSSPVLSPGSLPLIQYAHKVLSFSSHYGTDRGISYHALNLLGHPNVYPSYGDATHAFSFRSYGHWQNKQPFSKLPPQGLKNCLSVSGHSVQNQDFVELKYDLKVYPFEVKVYETYNVGALNQIYAFHEDKQCWLLLWKKLEKVQISNLVESRIFSPYLLPACHEFKTNHLLLEFSQANLDYFYQIDAVALVGSIFPCKSFSNESFSLKLQESTTCSPNWSKPAASSYFEEENHFQLLPYEIGYKIFSYLDFRSLLRAARTCRSFQRISYDCSLYKVLNLQPYWSKVTDASLQLLQQRLDFKAQLHWVNLSWCKNLSSAGFCSFIEAGKRRADQAPFSTTSLSFLRLANCEFVIDTTLEYISLVLPNLKELILNGCRKIESFGSIALLVQLQTLGLSDTDVTDDALISILRSCKDLEHLSIGNCVKITTLDNAIFTIRSECSLITLDLWRGTSLRPAALFHIANNCSRLEDIDIGWCLRLESSSGCFQALISKQGVKLRRLILTSIRSLRNDDLWLISKFCPYLEQLDVSGSRDITEEPVEEILNNCRMLCLLDVSYSHQITKSKVEEWRRVFSMVQIKRAVPVE